MWTGPKTNQFCSACCFSRFFGFSSVTRLLSDGRSSVILLSSGFVNNHNFYRYFWKRGEGVEEEKSIHLELNLRYMLYRLELPLN